MNWIELNREEEIDSLLQESIRNPDQEYIIFKHSTRCGTSRMARNDFEKEWNFTIPVYQVNVVENRKLSDRIEKIFNVTHESPQVLVVRNGQCIYDDSHYGIDAAKIMTLLSSEPS